MCGLCACEVVLGFQHYLIENSTQPELGMKKGHKITPMKIRLLHKSLNNMKVKKRYSILASRVPPQYQFSLWRTQK